MFPPLLKRQLASATFISLTIATIAASMNVASAKAAPVKEISISTNDSTRIPEPTPEELNQIEKRINDPDLVEKLRQSNPNDHQVTTYGAKSWLAKQAVKGMKWALEKMGKERFEKAVKFAGPPTAYITFDKTWKALDIAIGIDGEIGVRVKEGFKRIGMSDRAAGITQRIVTTILL